MGDFRGRIRILEGAEEAVLGIRRVASSPPMRYKLPVSVLVLVHTPDLQVLLLERADYPEHWQSVTGSQEEGETLEQTARRELREETRIDAGGYRLEDWGVSNEFE